MNRVANSIQASEGTRINGTWSSASPLFLQIEIVTDAVHITLNRVCGALIPVEPVRSMGGSKRQVVKPALPDPAIYETSRFGEHLSDMMRRMSSSLSVAVTAMLLLQLPVAARQAPTAVASAAIDLQSIGPRVGERVPDFSLRDQSGRERTLKSLTGAKGLMLVFFRSADW
jgi:hypothetical protein